MNLSAIYIILMLKEYKIYRLCTYLISLGLIAIMLNLFPVSKQRLIDQTFNDFTSHSTEVDNKFYIFSKPHNDMYITAYRIFLDNKLFGVGPRQFRNTCEPYKVSNYSCETHPHNTYFELLSESGIFSFTMVMSVFILISFLSIKHFASKLVGNKKGFFNDFEVCLLSAMVISLWPFSPSGSFFNNWMSIVYYFPVGILLWQRTKYKRLIKKKNYKR
jgi:O-antigen ligase